MARNDAFVAWGNDLADGGAVSIEGGMAGTGAVEIGELAGTGAAELYRDVDVDGDGAFETSVRVETFAGEWHTQQNAWVVSERRGQRLRLINTSGGPQDYVVCGFEVDDVTTDIGTQHTTLDAGFDSGFS